MQEQVYGISYLKIKKSQSLYKFSTYYKKYNNLNYV